MELSINEFLKKLDEYFDENGAFLLDDVNDSPSKGRYRNVQHDLLMMKRGLANLKAHAYHDDVLMQKWEERKVHIHNTFFGEKID